MPSALKDYLFVDSEAEYQLEHNVPVDISRRELAAPAGARHLRKPDGDGRMASIPETIDAGFPRRVSLTARLKTLFQNETGFSEGDKQAKTQ